MNRPPKRKVIKCTFARLPHCPRKGGRYLLKLECGHETSQKASICIPKKTNCIQCRWTNV